MKLFLTIFVIIILSFQLRAARSDDFETGDFSSLGWQMNSNTPWLISGYQAAQGNFCARTGYVLDGQISILAYTLETTEVGEISFSWKSTLLGNDVFAFYINNVELASLSGYEDWQTFSQMLDPGIYTFSWTIEKDPEDTEFHSCGWLDDVQFPVSTTTAHDLAIKSFYGQTVIYSGDESVFDVVVKNYGTESQNAFFITLLDEDSSILEMIEIETLLASEEEITCQIALILPPSDELQTTFIKTEIVVDPDDDPANNISNPLNLYILPFGQISQRIGTGTFLTTWYPMNFNFHNSLSETIYYPSEMVYTGEITAVSYFNHFMSNLYNIQTRMWIGTTSQNNLANGWVPAGNLTEVFNGYVDYPFGNNQILIPLSNSYYYSGGNLAVMCNRPWDMETYSMDDDFYGTTNSPYFDRTRAVNSNTTQINPDSPPEGYLFSRFPNTVFHIEVDNIGSVEGFVKNTSQQLLDGAVIAIQETQRRRIANSEGYFLFGNLLDETYQFKASCLGYEDQIIVQTVIPDQVMGIEFFLEALPLVEIYGQLRGSDQQDPGVEGADIRLTGYDNGFTISDENGFFQLSNVYAGRDYELIITHPSYQQENVQIELGYNDMDLGEIVISERAFPPDMVWADLDADENTLELSWHVPPTAPADSRELVGYDIYRFLFENNINPDNWIQLAVNYPDTVFVDQEWAGLPFDDYQYAVYSIYTAEVKSDPAYSNVPSYQVAAENPHLKPAVISLGQSYPNPFLLSGGSRDFYTRLNFSLIDNAKVELSIYNLKGEKIITLLNQDIASGEHSVFWDGMDDRGKLVNSGIYFYRFVSGNSTLNRKLVILK